MSRTIHHSGVKKGLMAMIVISGAVACTSLGNLDELRAGNRQNLVRLNLGMTKQEVLKLMGTESKTNSHKNHEQLTVTNPYRNETYQVGGNVLEVLYYYTEKNTQLE